VGTGQERVVATLPAQVAMDEDHTVRIISPVVGRVTALLARPSDRVAGGQVLARIASGDLAQAASDLVKAEASAHQAEESLTRAQDLYDHGVIALKDLEQARTDDAQARAERDRARLRAGQLGAKEQAVQGDYVVRAPFAGTIVDRSANPGGEVRNDNGQVLFTLSSLDTVWIVASAYEHDLPNVRRGNLMQFSTESVPGRAFDARVLRVSRVLDTQTHTATLTAAVANPGGILCPQMFGEARVMAPDQDRDPVVPTAALVTQGAGTVVFVEAEPGRFVRRPVTVGQDDGVTAVITNGLRVGERVVTRGSLLLAGEMVR
jgi:cobalt-zinc-cadmium efflux system membrane fusion protein